MLFVGAFAGSLSALILFLVFKMVEHEHPLSFYRSFRTSADAVVVRVARYVSEQLLLLEEQLSVRNIISVSVYKGARVVVHAAENIGRHAEDVSKRVARSRGVSARATKSSFLSEVETHKNGLDTERVRKETSFVTDED